MDIKPGMEQNGTEPNQNNFAHSKAIDNRDYYLW